MRLSAQFGIRLLLLCSLLGLLMGLSPALSTRAQTAVVRAVLFYSPTCPHCHKVITEDLPPLLEKYGNQFQIVGVDVSTTGGQALFLAAIQWHKVPPESQVVPMLFVDDIMLIGSIDIPEQLPGLIEKYQAKGGVDWPDIPGLREAIEASQPTQIPSLESTVEQTQSSATEAVVLNATFTPTASSQTVTPAPEAVNTPTPEGTTTGLIQANAPPPGFSERLASDPAGNLLAIVVLIGMLLSFGGAAALLLSTREPTHPDKHSWVIPVLCGIGLLIAGYLTYVETAQVSAVCGPVGDCNTVQQSEFARVFGVFPVGVMGLLGYLAIGTGWTLSRFKSGYISQLASALLLGMTLFGVLFSIYLTFLEPFVIGATCMWCLSSAVIMTGLLWLTVNPGKAAIQNLLSNQIEDYPKHRSRRSVQSKRP
jgi:uncharacterized membrane protein/thiol-disulfide isomerase/thioredoxin